MNEKEIFAIDEKLIILKEYWPKVFCDIFDFVTFEVKRKGVVCDDALIARLLMCLSIKYGGECVFIPNRISIDDLIDEYASIKSVTLRDDTQSISYYQVADMIAYLFTLAPYIPLPQGYVRLLFKGVFNGLLVYCGSQGFYFPRLKSFSDYLRNNEIYNRFNGSNHRELSADFDLSYMRIYQILKKVGKRRLEESRQVG